MIKSINNNNELSLNNLGDLVRYEFRTYTTTIEIETDNTFEKKNKVSYEVAFETIKNGVLNMFVESFDNQDKAKMFLNKIKGAGK